MSQGRPDRCKKAVPFVFGMAISKIYGIVLHYIDPLAGK